MWDLTLNVTHNVEISIGAPSICLRTQVALHIVKLVQIFELLFENGRSAKNVKII